MLFIKNSRLILTKTQLLEKLWDVDGNFVDEHTLTTIISRIRKKIEVEGHKYIKTAYGILDFIRYACAFFFVRRQFFEWRFTK